MNTIFTIMIGIIIGMCIIISIMPNYQYHKFLNGKWYELKEVEHTNLFKDKDK